MLELVLQCIGERDDLKPRRSVISVTESEDWLSLLQSNFWSLNTQLLESPSHMIDMFYYQACNTILIQRANCIPPAFWIVFKKLHVLNFVF